MNNDRTLVITLLIVGILVLTLVMVAGQQATAPRTELPGTSQAPVTDVVVDSQSDVICIAEDMDGVCREYELTTPVVITPGPGFHVTAPRS